jgi:diguanylate cyclase (GGDEF)-like protein
MFAYWGQAFCHELANKAELIIEDKTREFVNKSGDLEFKLKFESNHDGLTNLPNAKLISERISQGIKQLQVDEHLSLIIININNFKQINYEYGSFSANSLLLQFAELLKSQLLEPYLLQSYMGMNMIGRLQGAEFALLIPRLRSEHNLVKIIESMIAATSAAFMIDGNNIEIKTTLGVSIAPQHGTDEEMIIHHATLSLFAAEKNEKRYAIYNTSMHSGYKSRRIMFREISAWIENEELEIFFKPHYELKTKKIIGADTRIDFEHNKYGQMDSDKVMSIIEGTSIVNMFSVFMLRSAVKYLHTWQQEGFNLYLTVQLFNANDLEFPSYINSLLGEHNISAACLKIAITEKACLADQTRSIEVLSALKEIGVKIMISDFCSGYSSFVYLPNFPISEVKIDPAFVANMIKDEKKHSIVKAIIKLSEAMNLKVFASGINDEESVEELIKLGCYYGSGPYFYTPVVEASFKKLLLRQNGVP